MKKETIYTYLGTNGVLTTPIHLEGIYSIKKIKLTPERMGGKITNNGKDFVTSALVPESEVNEWYEV